MTSLSGNDLSNEARFLNWMGKVEAAICEMCELGGVVYFRVLGPPAQELLELAQARLFHKGIAFHSVHVSDLGTLFTFERIRQIDFEELLNRGLHDPVVELTRASSILADEYGYPKGWPKCRACDLPVLDGKLTCGTVGH